MSYFLNVSQISFSENQSEKSKIANTNKQHILATVAQILLLDGCVTSDKLLTNQALIYLPQMKRGTRSIKFLQFFSPHNPPCGTSKSPVQTVRAKKQAEVLNNHFKVRQLQRRPFQEAGHQKPTCCFYNEASLKPPSGPWEFPLRGSVFFVLLFSTYYLVFSLSI